MTEKTKNVKTCDELRQDELSWSHLHWCCSINPGCDCCATALGEKHQVVAQRLGARANKSGDRKTQGGSIWSAAHPVSQCPAKVFSESKIPIAPILNL